MAASEVVTGDGWGTKLGTLAAETSQVAARDVCSKYLTALATCSIIIIRILVRMRASPVQSVHQGERSGDGLTAPITSSSVDACCHAR